MMLSDLMLHLASRFVQGFDVLRIARDMFVALEARTCRCGQRVVRHMIAEVFFERPDMRVRVVGSLQ